MGGTDEQPFLISQHWYDVEKFALPGSSKLKFFRGTAKSFVSKWLKKNVLHFVLSN